MNTAKLPVKVAGDPNEVSSLVACVVAIAKHWGNPVDYAYVAGLAGVAFSPVWDHGEDCTAWWMEGGEDLRLAFMGRALGFTSEAITHSEDFSEEVATRYEATKELPSALNEYLTRIKTALDNGAMVILRTWPAWSVLTGWHEDIRQLPFATVPGFEELCASIWGPHKSRLAYILSPATPSLDNTQAVVEALKFGADLASDVQPHDSVTYGGTLYEAAAARMGETFFCPSCQEQDVGCAHRTVKRMRNTQQSAAAFLQSTRDLLKDGVPHADQAIARYAEMQAIPEKYLDYKAFASDWKDTAFRTALTEDFRKLAALHKLAAQELKKLAATL